MAKIQKGDVPLGFGMALAQDQESMARFGRMSASQRGEILRKAGDVNSKEEMAELVRSISNGIAAG